MMLSIFDLNAWHGGFFKAEVVRVSGQECPVVERGGCLPIEGRTMKHPFICNRCREIVSTHSQYEVRMEVRTKDHTRSLYSKTTEFLCHDCALNKVQELKGQSGIQEILL